MNMKAFWWMTIVLSVVVIGCSIGLDAIDSGPPGDDGDPGATVDIDTFTADDTGPPAMVFHGCDGPVDLDAVPQRQFIVAPYLILPKPEGITVRWEAMDDGPAYLLWGREGAFTDCTCAPPPTRMTVISDDIEEEHQNHDGWIYSVTLTGLDAWTRYDYTLVGAMVPTADAENAFMMEVEWEDFGTAHFKTAPHTDQDFEMLAFGDNQPFTLFQEFVVMGMLGVGGDMVLHTGDIVHNGWFEQYRYHYMMVQTPLFRLVPHLHTSGNHEQEGGAIPFDAYFPVPGGDPVTVFDAEVSPGPRSGYMDYGNARYFIMDSERSMNEGSDQLVWLDEMLNRTVHKHPQTKWLFAAWHRPTYSQADNIWGEEPRKALHEVMKRWRVDVVFNGHVHVYERFVQDDVVYIVTGGGGAGLNPDLDSGTIYPDDNKVAADLSYHFVKGKIGGNSAEFQAIRGEDGSTIETFTISAKDRSDL